VELLEREIYLGELDSLLRQAAVGRGHLLFLGGEAGVGKSVLVRHFADRVSATARVLTGSCDPLSTPRPLGPLIDISESTGGEIAAQLQMSAPRAGLFKAVLAELSTHSTTMVVIEDVHWADEATLDLLRYLGRRLSPRPALVIATYRDDEVSAAHPLLRVLGDLATADAVRRLALQPLSVDAVAQLARGRAVDPAALHRLTGGNPFFVTEALALRETRLPSTVRDAVLARASRLSAEARHVLDVCAVIGSPIEAWLIQLVEPNAGSVSACLDVGILTAAGSNLVFRHELARQAVLEAISPFSRVELHKRVLAALRETSSQEPARLAHHAEEAGDGEAVLEFAPAAAERAVALRSHREAAAQYGRALRFADGLPSEQRAALLEAFSYECYLTDQVAEAVAACKASLDIWRRAGDRLREGDAERKLSRVLWVSGRNLEALGASLRAIRILETLPDSPALAMAYSNQSHLRMTAWYSEEAIKWGEKAIALAEQMGEIGTLVHALNNVGTAKAELDDERGVEDLRRSLALAIEHGLEDHASRTFSNLCWNYIDRFHYAQADPYLTEGIAYCAEHDLEFMRLYLLTWRAICLMYQGQWVEARGLADSVLGHSRLSPMSRIRALVALGRVQSRQGDPKAMATLDRALELASPIGELQRLGPVRTARAEAAWLSGDPNRVVAEATDHYEIAALRKHRWLQGELAFWRWRAGDLTEPPEGIFEPFALQISGNWREAASRWRSLGYPYEAASALADSDDEADLRYALAEFNRLGAAPMAVMVSARLRKTTEHRIRHRTSLPAAVVTTPETRYARSGDVHIAFQVIGDGPVDLVFVMGWVSNVEQFWEGPSARFLRRLASFSRLIIFDKRGTGLSDRVTGIPTLEERMDDVRAVMEAAGSSRAALIGISEGAPMCALFAATYPERTSALIIYGGFARRLWAPDYPWAPTMAEREKLLEIIERDWGGPVGLQARAPSVAADEEFQRWWSTFLRSSASPGAAKALSRMNSEIDVRHVLPTIQAPTLVVHRTGDQLIEVGSARYMAGQIPNAKYVELPGIDHLPFAGDQDAILDEVELFLTGARPAPQANQVLATLVAVEIDAGSGLVGPSPFIDRHSRIETLNQAIREEWVRFRGERLPASDEKIRAAFDGPGRAIRFACAAVDAAQQLGMQARAGLHTGECDRTDGQLRGLPLEVSTEIAAAASPGHVVLSSTVRDLVAGTGIAFREAGKAVVDAFPGGLTLYEVIRDTPSEVAITGKSSPRVVMEHPSQTRLSKRETEIAILIAGGLSNRQIANELCISPATAERHVSNIFNKLGYHSRAQIAAWAVERDLAAGKQ
jgi:pimeloyl-ACP methyl ester carboxylesterase/DNA-binding CsgD family transcriptional regulator